MWYRPVILAVSVVLASAVSAAAQKTGGTQTTPRVEVFVGFGAQKGTDGSGQTGWSQRVDFGLAVNVNDRVAVVVDNLNFGWNSDSSTFGVAAGPRVRFGGQRRVAVFVQGLVGLQRWGGTPFPGWPGSPADRGSHTSAHVVIAGGVDLRITRHFSWRLVQVEQQIRFGDDRTHTRATTGIVFGFGGHPRSSERSTSRPLR